MLSQAPPAALTGRFGYGIGRPSTLSASLTAARDDPDAVADPH